MSSQILESQKINYDAHLLDMTNPHAVTTSQIGAVPISTTINGKALSGNIALEASDVGARPDNWMPTAAQVGAVPTSRTINGKALSSNITLTASDLGINTSGASVGNSYTLIPSGWYGGTTAHLSLSSDIKYCKIGRLLIVYSLGGGNFAFNSSSSSTVTVNDFNSQNLSSFKILPSGYKNFEDSEDNMVFELPMQYSSAAYNSSMVKSYPVSVSLYLASDYTRLAAKAYGYSFTNYYFAPFSLIIPLAS